MIRDMVKDLARKNLHFFIKVTCRGMSFLCKTHFLFVKFSDFIKIERYIGREVAREMG